LNFFHFPYTHLTHIQLFESRIPCECRRKYIWETSRPLGTKLKEDKYNLRLGIVGKSKLAAHAIEEIQRTDWDKTYIVQTEASSYRKYKGATYVMY
jgi:hypothetical protein